MYLRALLVTAITALLVGGVFVLRPSAPTEAVAAASSVRLPAHDQRPESVSVLTEVVTAQTISSPRTLSTPRVLAASARSAARPKPLQSKRSLFARLLLGSGETRPEPFPRPGRGVNARP
jgi:hypothetical protein